MANLKLSFVIPTRNRFELACQAIESVLLQATSDIELIVSDLSTDDRLGKFIQDNYSGKNVKYIRPDPTLNMPDHWNYALTQVSGEYVSLLTDRSVLKNGALAFLLQTLEARSSANVLCWRWDLYDEGSKLFYGNRAVTFKQSDVREVDSVKILDAFFSYKAQNMHTLPRMLNCCVSTKWIHELKTKNLHLFTALSPDYSAAFLILALEKQIVYIDNSLFISTGLSSSNGGQAYTGAGKAYLLTLGNEGVIKYCPWKYMTVENSIYDDFFRRKKSVGLNLERVVIDWQEYFRRIYVEMKTRYLCQPQDREELSSEMEKLRTAMEDYPQAKISLVENNLKIKLFVLLKFLKFKAANGSLFASLISYVEKLRRNKPAFIENVYIAANFDRP